ncbi:MAG: hypothetical protein JNK25_12495 [Phycisphaerae bacterium]|nr:hypothetical protein [Phycisphaerae bacterium]
MNSSRRMSWTISTRRAAGLLALVLSAGLFAQPPAVKPHRRGQFTPPPLSEVVTQLLEQDYLTPAERAGLRVRHGAWEEADLVTPALKASAALTRGALSDPALLDRAAAPADAAEAAVLRGDAEEALLLLKDATGMRAARVRAEALLDLGRTEDALATLRSATAMLGGESIRDADELAEGVRCAMILSRWQEPGQPGSVGHQRMLTLLAKARDELDRSSWRSFLIEAQLLYEKDMYGEVGSAIESALSLNPRCAEAYWLYGQVCIDTFDFDRGEAIAAKLDELAAPSLSPWAACLRAYVRLRRQEGVEAESLLAPALAAYPRCRVLLAYHAAAAAGAFRFEESDARLNSFDELSPGSPDAYMHVGKTMSGARQYDEAATYLREAARRAPHWAQPIVELGLSEFQAGRNQAALKALERATRLDPHNKRAANSLILLNELETYVSVESDHFIVRCKDGIDKIVAAEMLEPLEAIFERVTGGGPGGINHKPTHKTVVELYPNHRWFGVRITGMPALHTIAAATGPVIAMEAPRDGPGHLGEFDWKRVVQHEYTHTVTLSRTKNRLPHWFTEASAVFLEDAPRDYSTVQLLARAYHTQGLFDLDKINIMFARPEKPSDRSQAYAQGHAMYEFIIDRFGADKPLLLMDEYAKGVRESEAFQSLLGVTRDEFLSQFGEWLSVKLEEWGMLPTEANPSVVQLLKAERNRSNNADAPRDDEAAPGTPAVPAEPDIDQPKPSAPDEESGPTPEMVEKWLEQHPRNPFVLSLAVSEALGRNGGKADAGMVKLLREYAQARPVDPLPHKALAAFFLAGGDPDSGARAAIPHLEYLDAREQHSPGYAVELAKQFVANGELEQAALKASRATQIAPYNPAHREFAAKIAVMRKDWPTAARHLRALIVLEPDREVHTQRLEALERLSR